MAEGLLFYTIEKLIGKLGSMAVEAWNVGDDVEKLVESMSEIKAIIMDAEEQHGGTNKSHQVQLWLEKLKDALYDADDLLDDFSTELLRRQVMTKHKKVKKVRTFFSSSNQILFSFNMAPKIKDLRKRIEALNVDRRVFNFTHRTPELRVVKLRETHSFIHEEEVIGREEEKKELIDLLLNTDNNGKEKDNVSVISIIGIGGLGKTALAQLVYNDKSVQQHFELKMWVCVADEDSDVKGFDVKGIATKIVGSKTGDGMDEVQQKLRKKIEGNKYLLVLDDVWNDKREQWLQLKTLLADGARGSKIILTTRSGEVAKISGALSLLFLKGLDETQSWKLFSQLAFENGKEPENPNLVFIGKEIVEKCAGVPLAIRSIGSLMYSMENGKDWSSFKNKDLAQIDEEGGNAIFQLIKLSYDHLPFHLKKCFAFCSLFPKDYSISKTELIRLWIAQGFVELTNESTSLEDTGDKYVMTLIDRSFFQDVEKDIELGGILRFKMHDLVHDLARHISRNDYVLVNEKRQQHIDKRTRHVSFGFVLDSSWQIPSSLLEVCKLRTLLLPEHTALSDMASLDESICNSIMSCSKQFRVLNLNHINSSSIPSCIGMLKHLRYLDLSNCSCIEVLPRSITKLYNLETLLLNYCTKLREFPEDLWKLTSLRHLEFYCCVSLRFMPRGIGQLSNLQTLTLFILDTTSKQKQSAAASELENLNNLRELNIEGMECLRHSPTEAAKGMNLMGKLHLQKLTLNWGLDANNTDQIEKDDIILQGLYLHPNMKVLKIHGFCGVTFSNSVNSFTNLSKLTLSHCLRLQYLPPTILHIRTLTLSHLPCLKWIVNDSSNNINNGSSSTLSPLLLTEIHLDSLCELEGWCKCSEEEMQRGFCNHHLQSLTYLHICNCPNLISLPQHTNVKLLRIRYGEEKVLRQVVNHSNLEGLQLQQIYDLKSLSGVLQHLTELTNLHIIDCHAFDPCNDDEVGCYSMKWKELKNLEFLSLINIPKLECLPEGLQHVTSLQFLRIWYCDNLASIPEWATSLKRLSV